MRTKATAHLAFLLLLAGCGSAPPSPTDKGVLSLSWTIQGQPASSAVCAPIDHLVITVESTPSVGVSIAPVPCTRGTDWQRDDLPEGFDTILVDAVAPDGATTLEAIAKVGVSETPGAAPTIVDLQPL